MNPRIAVALSLVAVLAGCATSQPTPSYADGINQMQPPYDDAERDRQCAFLRSEIARMQNIAQFGASHYQGMVAMAYIAQSRNNIAVLESKAAQIHCDAAFGSRQTVQVETRKPETPKIEQCIAACKQNTSKTPEQCFEACNH